MAFLPLSENAFTHVLILLYAGIRSTKTVRAIILSRCRYKICSINIRTLPKFFQIYHGRRQIKLPLPVREWQSALKANT